MIEVTTPVSDLFANPEFEGHFYEFQRAHVLAHEAEGKLADHFTALYSDDPNMSPNEVADEVSYYLEMEDDRFNDIHGDNSRATDLQALRRDAESKKETAKSVLVEFGEQQGISQFALYGLWLHTRDYSVLSKPALLDKVVSAEDDLLQIDTLARNNTGEVLTVVDLMSAYAARLGAGGISIIGNREVKFPMADDTIAFGMSLSKDMPELHTATSLNVMAYGIHSILGPKRARILEDWKEVMDVQSCYKADEGAIFILGQVVEGPPVLSADKDPDFYHMIFEKIRTVGNAAASQ